MTHARQFRAEPSLHLYHGNLGVYRQNADHEAAKMGSALLAATIERAALKLPPTREKRALTFEEQLAAVEQGKARIVEKLRVANEPTYSLVGGTDWSGF